MLAALIASGCGRLSFDSSDAGSDDGAGGDGASGSDAALLDTVSGTFCAGKTALFCDDFESGDASPWQQGTPEYSTIANYLGELVVLTQTLADSGQISRASWRHLVGTAGRVTVAFDVETPVTGTRDPVVMALTFGPIGGDQHVFEWIHKLDGPAYIEEIVVRPPAADQYYFYGIPTTLTNARHTISLSYDAISAVSASLAVSIDGTQVVASQTNDNLAGDFYVEVGVPYFQGPSAPWEIHLDNLIITSP